MSVSPTPIPTPDGAWVLYQDAKTAILELEAKLSAEASARANAEAWVTIAIRERKAALAERDKAREERDKLQKAPRCRLPKCPGTK